MPEDKQTKHAKEAQKLTATTDGALPRLLLFHGWATHKGIWNSFLPLLQQHFEVMAHDLPGHGCDINSSPHEQLPSQLNDYAQQIIADVTTPVYLMGWSIGSLVCQQVALEYPDKVKGFAVINGNMCFVQRPHYPSAMPAEDFNHFYSSLDENSEQTIKRFIALQTFGQKRNKKMAQQALTTMLDCPASQRGLEMGMQWLRDTDFTKHHFIRPSLWLFGRLDKIVPATAATAISTTQDHSRTVIFDNAAHLPFITDQEATMQAIYDWKQAVEQA